MTNQTSGRAMPGNSECSISVLIEMPESLHQAMLTFLDQHPEYGHDRVHTAGLSLFLLQNGSSATQESSAALKAAARHYLNTIFGGVN